MSRGREREIKGGGGGSEKHGKIEKERERNDILPERFHQEEKRPEYVMFFVIFFLLLFLMFFPVIRLVASNYRYTLVFLTDS